jgi:hypothetical protein
MMSDLRDFFDERRDEVEQFFTFLNKIEEDSTYSSDMAILKSQAILMLYNLIEGSVNRGIEYIFDSVTDCSLQHNELSNDIRVMWFRYFNLHSDDNGQSKKSLEELDKFIDNIVEINLERFRKFNKSYFSSGTLDSSAIKKILKKFSIECDFSEYQLQVVKNDRNFLAHGEKSFIEVSQEKSTSDIENMKNKIFDYLYRYILVIEEYVDDEKYKI